VNSWRNNWPELSTFFKYPPEIRKIIYTTNIIESYHRQLRKVTKGKTIFPTDDALLKMLYLVTQEVMKKWTGRVHNWGQILLQMSLHHNKSGSSQQWRLEPQSGPSHGGWQTGEYD
jgi:transposase-like protein